MTYDYSEIVPYLLDWFEYNARILAWRENPLPYHIWISEIMLQQTRVEAVKGYYDRFLSAFPDIKSLAEAEEEKFLKLWEGLGYYNRVRNLVKAAKWVVRDYCGELPADYETLLKLPGIGSYTAGAIASIAFQIPVPAVDGNVLRVTKRIAGSFDDITDSHVKKELWQDLSLIMPKDRPGDFNQALMELGAMVCLPNGKPLCNKCPVMHLCKAFHEDTFLKIPVKPEKAIRRKEEHTILLIEYQDRFAIRKRAEKGILAGLWELPGLEGKRNYEEIINMLGDREIIDAEVTLIGETKHIFTHLEWHMIGYHIKLNEIPTKWIDEELAALWAGRDEIYEKYSIPNAYAAFKSCMK